MGISAHYCTFLYTKMCIDARLCGLMYISVHWIDRLEIMFYAIDSTTFVEVLVLGNTNLELVLLKSLNRVPGDISVWRIHPINRYAMN